MNTRIAAVFDVDGTLIARTSMEQLFIRFLWRRGELDVREMAGTLRGAVEALAAGRSPLTTNKGYLRGKNAARVRQLARECFETDIAGRLLPRAIERLRWHQQAGHFVLLLSGALDVLLEPLAEHFGVSARIGVELEAHDRCLSGRIAGLHPYGIVKADCLATIGRAANFDLKRSFAYANHHTDRFLLAMVGHPVAVNADAGLRRIAASRGWMIEEFTVRAAMEDAHGGV
jgi:putative phosphoserine phosphatase/1-acylglycerol-3-phosphate O-acyltransferase